ncbi:hypothetical protein FB45DRAFT_867284 [Roridomyces roridus]|uniref:Uncharacterized protein n=1 Tax=Roridomyces roridus TaxID=1738132 RepID=A0AAD7FPV6_9AGAR|nr:hypothetical protein FB45DRAFT_867284 [Roridomyces roridus]
MSLPSRKDLLEMKRPDIQRLCKDYGVRANLKTESLIELLLDTKKTNPRGAPPPQTRRSVSTRQASHSVPRISSVIIHDTDDEDAEGEDEEEEIENKPEPEPEPVPAATRSRKAKETQLRLGVGRPVQAGGSGPRAVTRSSSVAKGKRGKNSKAIKPVEETIQEEEEEQPSQGWLSPSHRLCLSLMSPAGPSQLPAAPAEPANPTPDQTADPSTLSSAIADALQPVYQQLAQLPLLQNELMQLKKQVADMKALEQKVATLTAQVDSQAAELEQLKHTNMVASRLALPPTSPRLPNSPVAGSSKAINLPNPGFAPSLLGKRHRDSTESNLTGVIEAGQEDDLDEQELAKTVVRPMKKRAKLDEEQPEEPDDFLVHDDSELQDAPPRVPSFTVYTGAEEELYVDPPPPTQALPAFYGDETSPSGSGPRRGPTTSTQHASENQHPFSYAFVPLTSTPADLAFPTFPYPEPPQSPSPSGPAESGPSRTSERTDIFAPFGLPAPGRPRSRVTSTSAPRGGDATATTVDPAALTGSPGLKRTMYGTELDNDTRFGDFGLESVASGFWASGGGRF